MMTVKFINRSLFSKKNFLRSFLSIISIGIGIAILVSVFQIKENMDNGIHKALTDGKAPQITFILDKKPSDEIIDNVKAYSNSELIELREFKEFELDNKNEKFLLRVYGIDFNKMSLRVLYKTQGSFPIRNNEIMFSNSTLNMKGFELGSIVNIGDLKWNIVGTGVIPGSLSAYVSDSNEAYIRTEDFDYYISRDDSNVKYELMISLKDYSDHNVVSENVNRFRSLLALYNIISIDVNEMKGSFTGGAQVELITSILLITGIIALFIGVLLSVQTIMTIVLFNLKNFGVMKSFGFSEKVISKQIFGFGFSIAFISTVIGCIGGYLLGVFLTNQFTAILNVPTIETHSLIGILTGIVVGMVCFIIASAYPNYFVTKQNSLDILKKQTTSGKFKHAFFIQSFSNRWQYRRLMKSPLRSLMVVLFISLATGSIIASFTAANSIEKSLTERYFNIYYNFEYAIEFSTPKNPNDVVEEFIIEYGSNIIIEPVSTPESVSIISNNEIIARDITTAGVIAKGECFNIKQLLLDGRLYNNDNEIVISERINRLYSISIGDKITIETPNRIREEYLVTGIVSAYENQGSYLYTTPRAFNKQKAGGKNQKLYSFYNIKLLSSKNISLKEIEQIAKRVSPENFVIPISDRLKQGENMISILKTLFFILSGFIASAALLGLWSTIMLLLFENKNSINSQLALGISSLKVIGSFIKTFIIKILLSVVLALPLGYILSKILVSILFEKLTAIDFHFSLISAGSAYILIGSFCTMAVYFTSKKVMNSTSIAEALKVED